MASFFFFFSFSSFLCRGAPRQMDTVDILEYGAGLTAGLLGAVHAAEGNARGGLVAAALLAPCQVAIAAARCCTRRRQHANALADFPETSGVFAGTAACSNAAYHCSTVIVFLLVLTATWDADTFALAQFPDARLLTKRESAEFGLRDADPEHLTDGLSALAFTYMVVAAAPFEVLRAASDIGIRGVHDQSSTGAFAAATALTLLRLGAFACSLAAFVYFVSQAQVILAAGANPSRCTERLEGIGQCADQGRDAAALRFVVFTAACGMIFSIQVFWVCRGIAFINALCTGRT